MSNDVSRENFRPGFTTFLVALSAAIGLGNIWKFPTLVGENGGGSFVLIYVLCMLCTGLPVLLAEFIVGRRSGKNVFHAFASIGVGPKWKIIGVFAICAAFCIMFFYSSIAGLVYSYTFKALRGDFSVVSSLADGEAANYVQSQFVMAKNGYWPLLWQFIALGTVGIVIMSGVRKGIERVTKFLMPLLLLIIIFCNFWTIGLSGFTDGVKFLLYPDFSKVDTSVILNALGLSFFKLSIGSGTMITYASYFGRKNNLFGTASTVAFSDLAISLMCGLIIFPVVFTFGLTPSSGEGLLFNTIPLLFSRMFMGDILLILFFLLASVAATTALMSLVEVIVAFVSEKFKFKRLPTTIVMVAIIALIGISTVNDSSIFGNVVVPIFNKNFFGVFDFLSSNVLLPVGGLLLIIMVGYFLNKDIIYGELTNYGELKRNSKWVPVYLFIAKFVTPILLLIILISSLL